MNKNISSPERAMRFTLGGLLLGVGALAPLSLPWRIGAITLGLVTIVVAAIGI